VKTISLKKVSAVAVASLGFGLLSVVPAQAAVSAATITSVVGLVSGGTTTAATATQAINNQVTFVITGTDTGDLYMNYTGVGSIQSAIDGNDVAAVAFGAGAGDTAWTALNGINYASGAKTDADTTLDVHAVTLTSTSAGTQTVKVQIVDGATGLYTSLATLTVTWLEAAGSAAVSAANSTIYTIATGGTCSFGSSKAGDVAAAAANADSTASVPTGTQLDICIAPRNSNGDLVAITTSSTVVSSLGASAALAASSSQEEENFVGATSPAFGPATLTAILIDNLGYSATISTTVNYWSTLSKLTITPLVGSAYAAADQTAPVGNTYAQWVTAAASTLKTAVVGMKATDALGTTIDLATSANSTATSAWTIDSDKVAGVPAARTSDALGAAVSAQSVAGEASSTKWGQNAAYITCSTKPEKLTLTAFGKNVDGDWVASNSIDIYCAGGVATVVVNPTAKSVAAGGTTTVNVDVKDANGYPAADNTSVTLTASDGSSIAPNSKVTASGKFAADANLVAGSNASNTIVTAIAGGKSGSATVTITGGASNTNIAAQIDALNAKIVALNALIAKIMKKLGVR
jgi:hypothetical protein